jgi:hypothetical protein
MLVTTAGTVNVCVPGVENVCEPPVAAVLVVGAKLMSDMPATKNPSATRVARR